jgi:uncharacterized protein (DUF4415 family)
LRKVDAHIIQPEEYEEIPELTDEMFERAVYRVGGIERPAPTRGRCKQEAPVKVPLSLRLSPEVVAAFKATGKGWQTRIDAALKEWLATHSKE